MKEQLMLILLLGIAGYLYLTPCQDSLNVRRFGKPNYLRSRRYKVEPSPCSRATRSTHPRRFFHEPSPSSIGTRSIHSSRFFPEPSPGSRGTRSTHPRRFFPIEVEYNFHDVMMALVHPDQIFQPVQNKAVEYKRPVYPTPPVQYASSHVPDFNPHEQHTTPHVQHSSHGAFPVQTLIPYNHLTNVLSPFSFSLTHLEDYKETNLSSNNAFRSFPQEMVKVISDGLMFTQKFQETMSLSTDSHEMIHHLEPGIQKHGLDFFKGAEMMINPTTFFSGIQKNIEEYYRVPRTELEIRSFQANIQERIVQFSEIFSYGNPVSSVASSSPITDGRSDHKPLIAASAFVANNLDMTIHDAEHMEDMIIAMKKKEEIIDFFIETLFSEQKLLSGIKPEAKNHIKPNVLNQGKLGSLPEILLTKDVHKPVDTYMHLNASMLTDVSATPSRPVITLTPLESQRPSATIPVATPRPLQIKSSGAASRPVSTPRPVTTPGPGATPRLLATPRSLAISGPVVTPRTVNTQRTDNSPRSAATLRPEVTQRIAAVPGAGETSRPVTTPRLALTPRPEGTPRSEGTSRPVAIPRSAETSSGADIARQNPKTTIPIIENIRPDGIKSEKKDFRHGHFSGQPAKPVVISIQDLNIPHHNYVAKIEKTPTEYDHNNILDNFLDDLVLQDSSSESFGDAQVTNQNDASHEKPNDTQYDSMAKSSFDMMLTSFLNSLLPLYNNDDYEINSDAMLKTVKTDLMHTMAELGSENLNHLVVLKNDKVTDVKINDMITNGILEVSDSKVEVTEELFVSMFSRNHSGSDFLNSKQNAADASNYHGNKFIFLPIQKPPVNSHDESNLSAPSQQIIKVPAELDNKSFVQPSGVVKSRYNYDVILLNPFSIDQSPDQHYSPNLPVSLSPQSTSDLSGESVGLVTKSSVLGSDKTATVNNREKNQFNFKLRKGLGKFRDGFKTKMKFGFANYSKETDSNLKDKKNLLKSSLNDIPTLVGSNQNKNIVIKSNSLTTVSYVFPTPATISASTDATSLPTDATSLSTDATSLSTDVTSLSTEVTSLSTDATSLSTDATSLPTDATSLHTNVTSAPFMFTSYPSDFTINSVDITNDLTATTNIFDETTFFPEDTYDVSEDMKDVSEDVTLSLYYEADMTEDTLYVTDNENDVDYILIPTTEDSTLSAEMYESFEDKLSLQNHVPCENNTSHISHCKFQEETDHVSIESDLEQLLTTSSRDPGSSESSVISTESSSEKLLNMSKQLLKQLTMATLGDSKLEQLPDLLEQIFRQLGLNAASTTEVASTSTSTSTRAYRAKNFKHRVLSSYYDKNGDIEEESVEEVEEDLKMGLLASLRSQIITNALEDRNIIAKAANVMRYFPGRRISSKSLRNFYKTGGSVESSEASADLKKELQDKLAAELNATLRDQLQSLKQRVEEEYSEKAGYEKDVVNSVRKQLEIFTSALRTQSDRKPANMNSKIDESETDLTKALEAQLRSFYANLL